MIDFNKKMLFVALSICFFGCLQGMEQEMVDEAEVEERRDDILSALMAEHIRGLSHRFPEGPTVQQNGLQVHGIDISEEHVQELFPALRYEAAIDDLYAGEKSVVLASAYHENGLMGHKVFNMRFSRRRVKSVFLATAVGKVRLDFRKDRTGRVYPVSQEQVD